MANHNDDIDLQETVDNNANESVLKTFIQNNNNENDLTENENYPKEEESPDSSDKIPDSSDIDVIDEDDDSSYEILSMAGSEDEMSTASLCSSSVVSQMSNLSFLRNQYLLRAHLNPDFMNEDLSDTSSLNYRELSSELELELNRGPRAYVHTPNTGLNGKLNLILILSVFTVIGLGIGNYIGWSNHWRHNKQLSLGQVLKLKQLQDELVVCMQNQANKFPTNGNTPQVCYTDNAYWRAKFETLFSENKDLLSVLEKTQMHYHLNGNTENIFSDKDGVNKSTSDEFHSLKLGFLVNQMEHLQLLKTLEEVQHKGLQSEKRVQVLEVENSQLKMKLVEEEMDDEVIVESWGNKVKELEDENKELQKRLETDEEEDSIQLKSLNDRIDELEAENNELKAAINQLEAQVVMVDQIPITSSPFDGYSMADNKKEVRPPVKLDLLKQRINQMVIENDELKSTIARLRWTDHQNVEESLEVIIDEEEIIEESEDYMSPEEINQLEDQLNELKDLLSSEQNESKKWKEMYEKLKKEKESSSKSSRNNQNGDNFEEHVIYDWVYNSTNILKDALVRGSGVVGTKLKELFDNLTQNKSIFSADISMGINATQTVFFELNRRLQKKWEELQALKPVLLNGNQKLSTKMSKLLERTVRKLQDAGNKLLSKEEKLKSRVNAFSNRISKLIVDLDNKWNNLLNKLSDRYSKQHKTSEDNYESEPKMNWFFERAKSRRQQQNSPSETETDGNRKSNIEFNPIVINDANENQFSDSGIEEDTEEENWFLRKAKKPKTDTEYEFEEESRRPRRNSYRNKQQFAQKLDYSSRQR